MIQTNHLKAYGISYWILKQEGEVSWLLNYRGGSFLVKYDAKIEKQCKLRGVSYNNIADIQASQILNQIAEPEENMDVVKQKLQGLNLFSKNKLPWDDAVTLVLTYAEIPYDVIYDEEIIKGVLPMYDWVHLHHEDFTGQYGKFWANYRNQLWYQEDVLANETTAKKLGFKKVSQLKLAVAKKLRDFVCQEVLCLLCSAPDSLI